MKKESKHQQSTSVKVIAAITIFVCSTAGFMLAGAEGGTDRDFALTKIAGFALLGAAFLIANRVYKISDNC